MKILTITLCLFTICSSAMAHADGVITLADYSPAHDADCWFRHANTNETMELGLIQPVNPSFDSGGVREVTNVAGFECKLTPHEGVTILAVNFPVPAIDIGRDGSIIVGYGEPIPVVAGAKTVLATVDVFFGGETSFPLLDQPTSPCHTGYNTWVQIAESYPASIPGAVSFVDADDPVDPLVTASYNPDHDLKIYLLQDPAVASEAILWGQVKALYR